MLFAVIDVDLSSSFVVRNVARTLFESAIVRRLRRSESRSVCLSIKFVCAGTRLALFG